MGRRWKPTNLWGTVDQVHQALLENLKTRAIILHNPQGQTPRERWHVLFTDDEENPARKWQRLILGAKHYLY